MTIARPPRPTLFAAALLIVALSSAQAAVLDLNQAGITDIQAALGAGLSAEKLVGAYLGRIEAYDKKGPTINSVILLNPRALDDARKLDAERKAGKVRGPLHGVPVVLKDNYDTHDLQAGRKDVRSIPTGPDRAAPGLPVDAETSSA
jgi:amidase